MKAVGLPIGLVVALGLYAAILPAMLPVAAQQVVSSLPVPVPIPASAVNGGGVATVSLSLNGFNSTGNSFVTGSGRCFGVGSCSEYNTNPTISSGFGTSPSVVSPNGTATFRVNVGTGGAATSGVVAMNVTANAGWNCQVSDITNATATRQTADSTTTVTVTGAAAWTASDILLFTCKAF